MSDNQNDVPVITPENIKELFNTDLIITLLNRLGGVVEIPVAEIDAAGGFVAQIEFDSANRCFRFTTLHKN